MEYKRGMLRRISEVRVKVNGRMLPIVGDIGYRADDLMEFWKYGNTLEDKRSYDLQGRLLQQTLRTAEGLYVHERAYEYDANSNITKLSVNGLAKTYAYDALDRIVKDGGVNPAEVYHYDLNGNRLRQDLEDDSAQAGYFYGEVSNHLEFIDRVLLTDKSFVTNSRSLRLEYNDAGRLWRLYENEDLRAEYIYNAEGQRTRKIVHTGEQQTVTVYHYGMGGELLTETNAEGQLVRDYVWIEGQAMAQIDYGAQGENLLYLHPDHLMTTRLVTDRTGVIVWSWEGEGFGGSVEDADPDGDGSDIDMPLRFPGQYRDLESGLYYNRSRYYDPSTGRYLTSDSVGLNGGFNTYGYANGNPIGLMDPLGLKAKGEWVEGYGPYIKDAIWNMLSGMYYFGLAPDGLEMASPSINKYAYLTFVRVHFFAIATVEGRVRCTECGDEWEEMYHKKISTPDLSIVIGPNVAAVLVGMKFGLIAGVSANVVIMSGIAVYKMRELANSVFAPMLLEIRARAPDLLCNI